MFKQTSTVSRSKRAMTIWAALSMLFAVQASLSADVESPGGYPAMKQEPLFAQNKGQCEGFDVQYRLEAKGVELNAGKSRLDFNLVLPPELTDEDWAEINQRMEQKNSDGQVKRMGARQKQNEIFNYLAETGKTERRSTVHYSFPGSRDVDPQPEDQAVMKLNYYKGKTPDKQFLNIPTYRQLRYSGLYPGVDVVVKTDNNGVKLDYHLNPGADWKQIQVRCEGARQVKIDSHGQIVVETPTGDLTDSKPYIYQEVNGERRKVEAEYRLIDNKTYGFQITGEYDSQLPLVIDPSVTWSTYLYYTTGIGGDGIELIRSDLSGNLYTFGWRNGNDYWITRMTRTGIPVWQNIIEITNSGWEAAYTFDAEFGRDGALYVCGWTTFADFPVGVATGNNLTLQSSFSDPNYFHSDGFLFKMATSDGSFIWGTFIGGTEHSQPTSEPGSMRNPSAAFVVGGDAHPGRDDACYGLDVISMQDREFVYVCGSTAADDFNVGFNWFRIGDQVGPDGIYAANQEWLQPVAFGTANSGGSESWFMGTYSDNSSWTSYYYAYDPDSNPDDDFIGTIYYYDPPPDGFIVCLTENGGLSWSTYLGGTKYDVATDIAHDEAQNVYVVGYTYSNGNGSFGFPVTGSLDVETTGVDTFTTTGIAFLDNPNLTSPTYSEAWPDPEMFLVKFSTRAGEYEMSRFYNSLGSEGDRFSVGPGAWGGTGRISSGDSRIRIHSTDTAEVYITGNTYRSAGQTASDFPVGNAKYTTPPIRFVEPDQSTGSGYVCRVDHNGMFVWSSFTSIVEDTFIYDSTISDNDKIVYCGTGNIDSPFVWDAMLTPVYPFKTEPDSTDAYIGAFTRGGDFFWGAHYGGSNDDYCLSVVLDPSNDIVVGGSTVSNDFWCSVNAYQTMQQNMYEGWIAKFSALPSQNLTLGTTDDIEIFNQRDFTINVPPNSQLIVNGFFDSALYDYSLEIIRNDVTLTRSSFNGSFETVSWINTSSLSASITLRIILEDGANPGSIDLVILTPSLSVVTSYASSAGRSVALADMLTGMLAQGKISDDFETHLTLANGSDYYYAFFDPIFYFEGGGMAWLDTPVSIPPGARKTMNLNELLASDDLQMSSNLDISQPFSVLIQSTGDSPVPIILERAMYWDENGVNRIGGHASPAVVTSSAEWCFAEGSTANGRQTELAIFNPKPETQLITIDFLVEDGTNVTAKLKVDPQTRITVDAAGYVPNSQFSMEITAAASSGIGSGVVVERTMYGALDNFNRVWGHNTMGATQPSSTWYFAEGATHSSFKTYLTIANPNDYDVTANVYFLPTGGGAPVTHVQSIAANERETIDIGMVEGMESNPGFAIKVQTDGDAPVVAERSMYWISAGFANRSGATNSIGIQEPSNKWYFAEGATGGSSQFEDFILIYNPSETDGVLSVQFQLSDNDGTTYEYQNPENPSDPVVIPAGTRVTVKANDVIPQTGGTISAAALVDCTVPVIAERAMYWRSSGAAAYTRVDGSATPGTPVQ
ncbi:SBBP repeat-containing protein [Candidatus Sumerlaeota bacterium]|nr:SBBP repeat-containing protein [Candidatus Sumerlaeota bacterium]